MRRLALVALSVAALVAVVIVSSAPATPARAAGTGTRASTALHARRVAPRHAPSIVVPPGLGHSCFVGGGQTCSLHPCVQLTGPSGSSALITSPAPVVQTRPPAMLVAPKGSPRLGRAAAAAARALARSAFFVSPRARRRTVRAIPVGPPRLHCRPSAGPAVPVAAAAATTSDTAVHTPDVVAVKWR